MSKRSNALNVKITVDDLSFHAEDTTITIGGVLEVYPDAPFLMDTENRVLLRC
jgi:hypothetical protein